jgi:hypothetical protein
MLYRLLMAAALTVPVFAFDDDRDERNGRWSRSDRDSRSRDRWERNDRRSERIHGYGNNRGGYGYGNNSGYGRPDTAIVTRTMQDLQSAASRNRVDSHERDHFNRAMSELQNMRDSQGSIDSRRLERVLEDLDHLSRADQIHPRDRQILARDRQALASLYNGYGNNRW